MTGPEYPQDISENESDLGFQRLEIDRMGRMWEPRIVVGRLLSSSDVLVKTLSLEGEIRYSHRRWGYWKSIGKTEGWMPLLVPLGLDAARRLIQEFDFGGTIEAIPGDAVGLPFKYRVVG